jgi:hypothetical protein
MNHCLKIAFLFLTLQAPHLVKGDSAIAFEAFKGFPGTWEIRSNGKTLPIAMSYEVDSKGSIVTEQFGKELSVIYQDGQNLLMTHFCNGGNRPRLQLTPAGSPGVFEFEMFDITNLKSADAAHVERMIYKVTNRSGNSLAGRHVGDIGKIRAHQALRTLPVQAAGYAPSSLHLPISKPNKDHPLDGETLYELDQAAQRDAGRPLAIHGFCSSIQAVPAMSR